MKLASPLTTNSMVLGCLCGIALAGVACGDGVGAPTHPSVITTAGSSVPLISPAAGEAAGPDADGQAPLHGSLDAPAPATVAFPFLSVHLTGTGNATHLGHYTATFDFRIDLSTPTSPAVGSFRLTGADGDSLFG